MTTRLVGVGRLALAALLAGAAPAMAGTALGAEYYGAYGQASSIDDLEALADAGDWRAQAALGRLYADGRGVPPDAVRAYYWLQLAAEAGDAESAVLRQDLARRMSAAERAEAEHRAAAWRPAPAAVPRATLPALGYQPEPGDGVLGLAGVEDLQWQLALHGYDPGLADGTVGPETRNAIADYQGDAGLPVDGSPSAALLDHLQYSSPPVRGDGGRAVAGIEAVPLGYLEVAQGYGPADEPQAAAMPGEDALAAAYAVAVQEELAARGYEPGPVDGIAGRRTMRAIRRYQALVGLPVDGEVSHALVNHLRFVTARQ